MRKLSWVITVDSGPSAEAADGIAARLYFPADSTTDAADTGKYTLDTDHLRTSVDTVQRTADGHNEMSPLAALRELFTDFLVADDWLSHLYRTLSL